MALNSTSKDTKAPPGASIATLYNENCIPRFDQLHDLLEQRKCDPAYITALNLVEYDRGRFRAWAQNLGAHRMGTSKLSLDYRLREASHVHGKTTGLLMELKSGLEDGQYRGECILILESSKRLY